MSDHSKSNSGVWMQMNEKEADLFKYDYFDREFSILNGEYKFKIEKMSDWIIDEYQCWLK